MWTRAELKARGKRDFKRNYWGAVLAAIIGTAVTGTRAADTYQSASDNMSLQSITNGLSSDEALGVMIILLVAFATGSLVTLILKIFVGNPFRVGAARFFTQCGVQEDKVSVRELLFAFKHSYMNIVGSIFLTNLFIGLWSLLLIVPGVIKAYQWLLVPYIMADHPEMKGAEARAYSRDLMQGNKWKAFVLSLSFIPWILLGCLTFGILLLFYVQPYIETTFATLYHELEGEE